MMCDMDQPMSFLSYTRMQSVDVAVWGSVRCGGLLRVLMLVLNLQTKHVTASAALNPGRADDKHAVHTHTHTHTHTVAVRYNRQFVLLS